MNINLYVAFLLATVVLIVIPGPTMMLITSKSLHRGAISGLIAVAGSALAMAVQLTIVVIGLASVVVFVSSWFEWIRWAGVVYLIYLGIRTWGDSPTKKVLNTETISLKSRYRDFLDGFVVTLTNPKTLLFLGAFLPQFVDPTIPALPQFLVLAISFFIVASALDSCTVLLAAKIGNFLNENGSHKIANRVSGSVLIGAGLALALARRTE